jgi:hypothetical protein
MKRNKLRAIINTACDRAEVDAEERKRLKAAADDINRIAVGSFTIREPGLECGCPATVAGYWVVSDEHPDGNWSEDASHAIQKFPHHFDAQIEHDTTLRTPYAQEYIEVED